MPTGLTMLRHGAEVALSFFYPDSCQYCRQRPAIAAEGYVCLSCQQNVRFIRPPLCERCGLPFPGDITNDFQCANCREISLHFSRARSAVAAEGMALEIIHRWKYRRELWFEPFLASLLIRAATPALQREHWDWIVPVPLHSRKENEREFNQAERLARHLSAVTGIPLQPRVLRRVAPTRTQALLSRNERNENVKRAFAPDQVGSSKGRRVVLIDDVLTTGATTSACARVLRGVGVSEVCVWTVARGLLH
jgi:competence protein ComFC